MTTVTPSPGQVVIVGGGTAGWLSAATFPRTLKMRDVTLVESSDIGIIGVDKGTFPAIRSTLAGLDIGDAEFLHCADATFKQGVPFDGWATGTDSYFHPFNMPIGGEDEALLPHWLMLDGPQDLLAQWRHWPPSRFDFTVDLETVLPPSYHHIRYDMRFETRMAAGPDRYPDGAEARAALANVATASNAAVAHLPDHRALLNQLGGRQTTARVS
ncbi:tryptophan 7-halogenase [Sphingobium sp.]|uniref:tryptophan 7-halogenase n=1 Tax=Sphingobium sp. TaxID=1912891 RepID=UPI002C0336AC|nr:tryptophan 7-halogenase [Sphingobium sp.]HUD90453.1 tryptophan 7-halogenase [Sphingobium sp.]